LQISVNDLISSLDYSLTYFLKILSKAGVKNRIILDEEDLNKILSVVPIVNTKSYNLHIYIGSLLDDKVVL